MVREEGAPLEGSMIRCLVPLAALTLLLTACSTVPAGSYLEGTPQSALNLYHEARTAVGEERRGEARLKLQESVNLDPFFVKGHRLLQDLALEDCCHGALQISYRALTESERSKPANHYLYGRLFSRPANQIPFFEKALDLDPSFYWGHCGLGFSRAAAGRAGESKKHFHEAVRLYPEGSEAWRGLLEIYLRSNDPRMADLVLDLEERFPLDKAVRMTALRVRAKVFGVENAVEAALAQEIGLESYPGFFRHILEWLDRKPREDLTRSVLFRYGSLAETSGRTERELCLLLGICCRRLGILAGARNYLSRVFDSWPFDVRARRELRFVLAVSGRFTEALAVQIADCPPEWLRGGRLEDARHRLRSFESDLSSQESIQSPSRTILALSEYLLHIGWVDEAIFYLVSLQEASGDKSLHAGELLREAYGFRGFEVALARSFSTSYSRFRGRGTCKSFEATLESLGRLSEAFLERNIFDSLVVTEYGPLGKVTDPRPSAGSSAAAFFRQYNRFFLLGQRSGCPVEACLFDMIGFHEGTAAAGGGGGPTFDVIPCSNQRIPSYNEFLGNTVAAAALRTFIFVNVDAVRVEAEKAETIFTRYRGREEALLSDPSPGTIGRKSGADRLDLEEPLGVTERLLYLSFREHGKDGGVPAFLQARYQALLSHEIQHIVDADSFLPLGRRFFWKLIKFASLGFDSFNVEAWLEERAQILALCRSTAPRVILSEITTFAGGPLLRSPHQKAYRRLVKRIRERIVSRPGLYPGIDRDAAILHQLFKLTPEEIREIGFFLAGEDGIEPGPRT